MTTPTIRLIRKKIDHNFIGNSFEAIDTIHEFSLHDSKTNTNNWCWVKYRKPIGKEQKNWRVFGAGGMRDWETGKKDKRKILIEKEIKNWFDTNGEVWENVNDE